jgi:hypothetical protein
MPDGANEEEAERQAEQRRRNALYSKRKYYKKKIEIEQLESRKFDLTIANARLKEDNARLESIVEDAQHKIQLIETPGNLRGKSEVHGRSEGSQRQRSRRQSQLPVNNLSDTPLSRQAATSHAELAATMAATAYSAPAAMAAERAASLSVPDLLAGLRSASSLQTGISMPGAANALSQLSLAGLPPHVAASLLPMGSRSGADLTSDDLRQRILRLQHEQNLLGSAPGVSAASAASAVARGLLAGGDAQRAQTTLPPPLGGYEALLLRSLASDSSQLSQSSLASQLPYFGSSFAPQPSLRQQLLQQHLLQQQLVSPRALLDLPTFGLVQNNDAELMAALIREQQLQAQLQPQVSQQASPTVSPELLAALLQQ